MTQSSDQPPPPAHIAYATVERPHLERDRRPGLIAFGIASILIGALAGFFAAMSSFVVTMVMLNAGKVPLWPLLVAPLINATAATLFIWVGIASIRFKRWVRPMAIAFGWPALIGGVMGVAGSLLIRKEVQSPPRALNATTILAALFAFFGVVIPAAFLWFYSTRAVKQTLHAYDPGPSWTENCPLPVFAGAVNLVLGGLITLSLATFTAAPFFGVFIEGAPAITLVAAAALVMFAAAVLFYRVRLLGWILALSVIVLGFLSAMITMGQLGVYEFYRRSAPHPGMAQGLQESRIMTGPAPLIFISILFTICLVYLLWVRPHFTRQKREDPATAAYPSHP